MAGNLAHPYPQTTRRSTTTGNWRQKPGSRKSARQRQERAGPATPSPHSRGNSRAISGASVMCQAGGKWFTPDGKSSVANSPGTVDGLNFMWDLRHWATKEPTCLPLIHGEHVGLRAQVCQEREERGRGNEPRDGRLLRGSPAGRCYRYHHSARQCEGPPQLHAEAAPSVSGCNNPTWRIR